MNEKQATAVAGALGGEAWHSGGGIWLVRISRGDGALVVISDDLVCEYADEDAFRAGAATAEVLLVAGPAQASRSTNSVPSSHG